MQKNIYSLWLLILLTSFSLFGQIPAGYYDTATGKSGAALKTALFNKIKGHSVQSYTPGVWNAYNTTDKKPNGRPWDIYSNKDWTFGSNQCGNYSKEGDCYNREHSFPKSWFNDASPMYSDIFHLYPSDGYVNGIRGNLVFGEVNSVNYTSTNGCKRGVNTFPGFSGPAFEPTNEFKGDIARTYFYMATRYENLIAGWEKNDNDADIAMNGTSFPAYETWYLNLMIKWHTQDPISQKEIDRNNAIYAIQGNRNPYIDHPEYAGLVWGFSTTSGVNTTPGMNTTPGVNTTVGNNTSILIDQNFANCSTNGWNVVTVTGKKWNCGSGYFEANGFVSGNPSAGATESWIISSPLSVSGFEKLFISFSSYTKFKDVPIVGKEVEALYSTNYTQTGNPNVASWTSIPNVQYPTENSQNLLNSGISTLTGVNSSTFYLAFKYRSTGSSTDNAALWRIDDVKVLGYNASTTGVVSVPGVVTVPAINLPPVVSNLTITGFNNEILMGSLAGKFSDPENNDLTIVSYENEATINNGSISISDFGDVSFIPNATFVGLDSFEYKICDPSTCTSAIIYFNVLKGNISPKANNLTITGLINSTLVGSISGLYSDLDNDVLTITSITNQITNQGGKVNLNISGALAYVPAVDFTGLDSYSYQVCDPSTCSSAMIYFKVKLDLPIARSKTYIIPKDLAFNGSVDSLILDPKNNQITIESKLITSVGGSSFQLKANGDFTYIPKIGFSGIESFTYKACNVDTCSFGTLNFSISGISTSVKSFDELGSIFPQPAADELHLKGFDPAIQNISILDIVGNEVLTIKNLETRSYTLDISSLASGTYFLFIRSNQSVFSKRILVMK